MRIVDTSIPIKGALSIGGLPINRCSINARPVKDLTQNKLEKMAELVVKTEKARKNRVDPTRRYIK